MQIISPAASPSASLQRRARASFTVALSPAGISASGIAITTGTSTGISSRAITTRICTTSLAYALP